MLSSHSPKIRLLNLEPRVCTLSGNSILLVAKLGEDKTKIAESKIDLVKNIAGKGMMAAEGMQSHEGTVKSEVIEGSKDFVKTSVNQAAVIKLARMFIPGGGLIQMFITGFDMVKFVINEGSRIASLVSSIMGGIANIANGNVGGAIAKVEQSLAKSIPLALSFLSRIFRVSGIGEKIKGIIQKVKAKIDTVVKKLMDKVAGLVAKMAGMGKPSTSSTTGAKPPAATATRSSQDPDHDKKVKAGLAEIPILEERYTRDGKLPKSAAKRIAKEIKTKHPIFKKIIAHVDQGKKARYQWFASEGWETGIKELWGRIEVQKALQDTRKTAPANWAALFATGGKKIEGKINGDTVHLDLETIWEESGRTADDITDTIKIAIDRTISNSGLTGNSLKTATNLSQKTADLIYSAIAKKKLHFVSNAQFIRKLSSEAKSVSKYIMINSGKSFTTYTTNAKNSTDPMMSQLKGEIHHALSLYLGGSGELANLIRAEGKAKDPDKVAAHYLFHNLLDNTTVQATNSLSGKSFKLGWKDLIQEFPEDQQKVLIGTVTEDASISYQQIDLEYKEKP